MGYITDDLEREEQKPKTYIPIYLCESKETMKGRTESQDPISLMILKGKNRNPRPIYPCESKETIKGRTETQNPILLMILRKGRTETQNPYTHVKALKL